MRGEDQTGATLVSYGDAEARIPATPLFERCGALSMRRLVNAALEGLDGSFSGLYGRFGRPSIAPERLLRAVLLQRLDPIRSERQLVERLECDSLFRWFVGLSMDERVFDASTLSRNRDRLPNAEIAQAFFVEHHRASTGEAADERRAFFGARDA